jgi:hypothetical protein
MKRKCLRACILSIAAGGLVLVSGCVVEPNGQVGLQLPVISIAPPVVVAPAIVVDPPVVEAPVMVPESYVWDGYEYVGFVGGQYFYLGPGNVWLVCEPFRLERFQGWERGHPDWRDHAIRNDRFRADRNGHIQPRHDEPVKGKPEKRKDDKN